MLENDIGEQCGIVAAVDLRSQQNVTPWVVEMAEGVQNRGPRAAGVVACRDGSLHLHAEEGLVKKVLKPRSYDSRLIGSAAMAHTLYSTSGPEEMVFAQPFVYDQMSRARNRFALAFNGNIANYEELKEDYALEKDVDTELLGQMILHELQDTPRKNLNRIFASLQNKADGAFNLGLLTAKGDFLAYRDRHGFRPLCWSENAGVLSVASEDMAIRRVWPHAEVTDFVPGQALFYSKKKGEFDFHEIAKPKLASCYFERIYFANGGSRIDGVGNINFRKRMGKYLAERDNDMPPDQVVVPVPDSGKAASAGYAEYRNLREVHALLRKPKAGRSFIHPNPEEEIKDKFDIDPNLIRGRDIILIDDSLVRGTTMREIAKRLRTEAGVAKIHLRLTAPPILSPCYYGIHFANTSKLIARKYFKHTLKAGTIPKDILDAMAKDLGVDSLEYAPVEAIPEALRSTMGDLCMACVTGEYPTKRGQERADEETKRLRLL